MKQGDYYFYLRFYSRLFFGALVDLCLELGSGLLGSCLGVLFTTLSTQSTGAVWSGVGFGFVFSGLAVSFVNRVLLRRFSSQSIGDKLFKLELVSLETKLDMQIFTFRWILSFISFGFQGYLTKTKMMSKPKLKLNEMAQVVDLDQYRKTKQAASQAPKKAA